MATGHYYCTSHLIESLEDLLGEAGTVAAQQEMGLGGQGAVVVVIFSVGLLLPVEKNALNLIHDLQQATVATIDSLANYANG